MTHHSHSNRYWERTEDGCVRITDRDVDGSVIAEHIEQPGSWASIVAAVSRDGLTEMSRRRAYCVHSAIPDPAQLRAESELHKQAMDLGKVQAAHDDHCSRLEVTIMERDAEIDTLRTSLDESNAELVRMCELVEQLRAGQETVTTTDTKTPAWGDPG